MLKKTLTVTNFHGDTAEVTHYFNLTQTEAIQMELGGGAGSLAKKIRAIVAEKDTAKMISIFKDIMLSAYGEVSEDGTRFIKNEELRSKFEQTAYFDAFFVELITDSNAAAAFVDAVVPSPPSFPEPRKPKTPRV